MKIHTSDFKNNIKLFGKEIDSIITYTINGVETRLGNEDLNLVSPYYEGSILKSVMKQLYIDSNVYIPEGTEINYMFGIKVRNNEVEDYRDNYDYVNFGNYIVYQVEELKDTNSYQLLCQDKMLYSMKNYEYMNITYPITIKNYIATICNHLGLTFKNINDTFVNYNKQIPKELYLRYNSANDEWLSLGYTFRDVLDELAEVTASTICINEDTDELEIRYITETNDTIDEEYLKDVNVSIGEKYGKVNAIILSRSSNSDNVGLRDEESITENGLCEIKIIDNQIMNGEDRASYLTEILAELDGLEYYTNNISSPGITYYNLCDRYTINIGENTYSCVMFNNEILVTKGLTENIYTFIPEKTETEYVKSDKEDNKTKLIVDGAESRILAEVDNGYATKASLELKVDKTDNNQIVSMLNASAGIITLNGGSSIRLNTAGKLIISAGNFKLDASGHATMTGATINDGDIIFKDTNLDTTIMEIQRYYDSTDGYYYPRIYMTNYGGVDTTIEAGNVSIVGDGNHFIDLDGTTGKIMAQNLEVENIQFGQGIANKNGYRVTFDQEFADNNVTVIAVPVTSASGVIALKLQNINKSGFTAMTGGTTDFGNITIHYVAKGEIS